MNIIARKSEDLDLLEIHGRIDGLTASEIKQHFDHAAAGGTRTLVADFGNVTYMSSAGLRIIIQTHKSLLLIGGQFILISVPVAVSEVFRLSGMDKFLCIYANLEALRMGFQPRQAAPSIESIEIDGIRFDRLHRPGAPGKLFAIGSPGKLAGSDYHRYDVARVMQTDLTYAVGLAALGVEYEDFHNLFGESVIIGHQFFSYPAVPHPLVDYSFCSPESSHTVNFLHGFGMKGQIHEVLRFDSSHETPTLDCLMQAAAQVAVTAIFGVVILAASGGILGMHLKRSPVVENKPADADILGLKSFSDWLSFPLEEEDVHKTIVGTGIISKTPSELSSANKPMFPDEGNLHIHAAVFENGLWSVNPDEFEHELDRVLHEFAVEKVVHLLPASRLKGGFIGIINLELA